MVKKAFKPAQIIDKLREAEVLMSQGFTVGEASRKLRITKQVYYKIGLSKVSVYRFH